VNINNPPKFYGVLVMVLAVTLLVAMGRVEWDSADALYTAILGYLVGNGVAAKNDQPVEPIIGRKKRGE
jgi:hypothetical protein